MDVRRRSRIVTRSLALGVLVAAQFAGQPVSFAEVLDPNKEYSDARDQKLSKPVMTGRGAPTGSWFSMKLDSVRQAVSGVARQIFGAKASETRLSRTAQQTPLSAPTTRSPAGSESAKPQAVPGTFADTVQFPGLSKSENGVVKYDLSPEIDVVPRLRIAKEERFSATHFSLDPRAQKTLEKRLLTVLHTPAMMESEEFNRLIRKPHVISRIGEFRKIAIQKGAIDQAMAKKLGILAQELKLSPETDIKSKLAKFVPLTADEFRFLSGLLLYQNGHQCAAAVGLFHSISNKPEWQAEADYFLAMCSKKLGLMTDFSDRVRRVFESGSGFYANRLLREVSWETPNVTTRAFGEALEKALSNPEVVNQQTPEVLATAAAIVAESAAAAEKFKTALLWAKKVPEGHPRYLQAKFVEALSEYQIGSKKNALELQEALIKSPRAEESAREFQGLIALNLARMYFQEQKYKEAHQAFLTVNKDHPLWLQGLAEMGWAQLLSGDYEGAIGNMYSIHSPFFAAAYKPESYVIRTIGYLNLCQYGDAYRTLTILEKDYRAMLTSIDHYEAGIKSFSDGRYGTVRRFLVGFNQPGRTDVKDVDGLPSPVIREIARQKDFLNLQKSLNRQIDERAVYNRIAGDIDRSLKDAQLKVTQTRKRIDVLRKQIAMIKVKPALEPSRVEWQAELDAELSRLNDRFFSIDLFDEAKRSVGVYNAEVIAGAEKRSRDIKARLETVIANRILKVRTDLSRFMDNNELLRYEVFAASGENIRFQVAGGEKSNRIPATVIPKSKSLQWDFDGEYWEDEIGHYRSSLKNNCPISGDAGRREQASLDASPVGGAQ